MFKKYFWGYGLDSAGIGWDQFNAESCNEHLGLINCGNFFDILSDRDLPYFGILRSLEW